MPLILSKPTIVAEYKHKLLSDRESLVKTCVHCACDGHKLYYSKGHGNEPTYLSYILIYYVAISYICISMYL